MASSTQAEPEWKFFRGMCDASALEMLDGDLFVAANDEDNVLRVYSRKEQGFPVQSLDFTDFYRLQKKKQEIDLEGSARIGNRIYWISSHGANAKGKFQPSRHRLFATEIVSTNGVQRLAPVGRLHAHLFRDLTSAPQLAAFNLASAARRPPKTEGALNIEGLASTPEGGLLIGFRNPIPNGKALLVPLVNPLEVTEGKPARFGAPLLLQMEGLGIRSIALHGDEYLIVAGPYSGDESSQLYRWDGKSERPTRISPNGLAGNPEGIAVISENQAETLFVLNDDGTEMVDDRACKKLKDDQLKVFRGYELRLGEQPL